MRERPILFSAPMIRALLDGRKTQTRRIVKPQPGEIDRPFKFDDGTWHVTDSRGGHMSPLGSRDGRCPYGVPGDLLWVRETCCAEELSRPEESRPATRRERQQFGRTTVLVLSEDDGADGVRYLADEAWRQIENTPEAGEAWTAMFRYGGAHPSGRRGRSVPGIHMPRWASRISLRITDVRVERLNEISEADALAEGVERIRFPEVGEWGWPQRKYAALWQHIHGPGSWDANPWVWALTFEVRS